MIVFEIFLILIASVYAFLVLKCCLKFYFYEPKKNLETSFEKVSVMVSAKNEEENISNFITNILSQSTENLEFVLIDDNSSDKTFEIAEKFSDIILKKNPFSGKKSALKYGIDFCSGEFLILTDADCFGNNQWAETISKTAFNYDADMILAPVIICAEDSSNIFQRLWEAEGFSLITITAGTCIWGKPVMSNGGNIGYKTFFFKNNILSLNKKYSSGDDMFMMESAQRQKKKIVYVKDRNAVVRTLGPKNLKQLLRQRSRWVSKTGGYKEKFTLFFAGVIFFGNFFAALLPFVASFTDWKVSVFMVLTKFLSDFFSVKVSSDYYRKKQKISDIIVLEIIYPYYVLSSVASFLFKGVRWK